MNKQNVAKANARYHGQIQGWHAHAIEGREGTYPNPSRRVLLGSSPKEWIRYTQRGGCQGHT